MQATHWRNRPRVPLADRLFAKLEPQPNGCVEFMGDRYKLMGYGRIYLGPRGQRRALRTHRVAWEMVHGPIPDGLFVLHRCDNPPCCNPDHLYLGTKDDNMDDMSVRRRARNSKKTHCVNGHEFTPENTVVRRDTSSGRPGRRCVTCRREDAQRRKDRRAAARKYAA